MGRYMTVILKEEYINDPFIKAINEELTSKYGASTLPKFNPWYELQAEAEFFNKDREGKKQLSDWKRPVTAARLSNNFFWYRYGEFYVKLSGCPTLEEAKEAVAVCKWIIDTDSVYIDAEKSSNYEKELIAEYLDYVFREAGCDLFEVWKMQK